MLKIEKITSRQNALIKKISNTVKSPDEELFTVEGTKFVKDLDVNDIKMLFTTAPQEHGELVSDLLERDVPVYEVTEAVMEKLCSAVSGQKLVAAASAPRFDMPEKLVILDSIQDSGNVGTIIRTAAAFGYGCILSEGCANRFSSKTVRSSAGAVMKCFTEKRDIVRFIPELKKQGYRIFSSELDTAATTLENVETAGKFAIIVGNEGNGVRKEVSALADEKVYIPISKTESLNAAVAAAIMMYTME